MASDANPRPPRLSPRPLPRDSKNVKKYSTDYHSLKRRFEQPAVSMASCGCSWVMVSRDVMGLGYLAIRSASWKTCLASRARELLH
jgi:hypothetical protein